MSLPTSQIDPGMPSHLRPNAGADPVTWRRVHDTFVAAAAAPGFPRPEVRAALRSGRYRVVLLDELGTRDAAAPALLAVHRFLRAFALARREPLALVLGFVTPAATAAEFDGLLWGQLQAMHELDRLQFPRARLPAEEAVTWTSFGGRACVATGLRVPVDLLVLDFQPQDVAVPAPPAVRSPCV